MRMTNVFFPREMFWRVLLLGGAVVISFAVGEGLVRIIGEQDARGQFVFRGHHIRPYQLPLEPITAQLQAYQSSDRTRVIYHPILGWTHRPNHRSSDGLYHYNSRGLRSTPQEFSELPAKGVLRIALFGDSYTHGDDVSYEYTFAYMLEQRLNARGITAEVMNFGVGGYGIDQAFLRFRHEGTKAAAHLIVFGFQAEDVKRNLNLIRPLFFTRTGLPFAKPRFVLKEEQLELINVPVLPTDRLLDTLLDFDRWELSPYEAFYEKYANPWWRRSKLLAVSADLLGSTARDRSFYDPHSEAGKLALKLIETFKLEAKANGAEFLIVHLPELHDLRSLCRSGQVKYQSLLDELDARYEVVHPEAQMLATSLRPDLTDLFAGHYNYQGNLAVADVLFTAIIDHEGRRKRGALPPKRGTP